MAGAFVLDAALAASPKASFLPWSTGLRRILLLTAASVCMSACAQVNSDTTRRAELAELQADPAIAAETDTLNQLIRVIIDANRLYDQAADEADDAQLQATLRTMSAARKKFAQSLQKRVTSLGGDPAETGRSSGAIHRSFIAVRGLVDTDSVAAASEVYRGEGHIIEQMDQVLRTSLTPRTRAMVQAELVRVMAGRDDVELVKSQIAARLTGEAARKRTAEQATTNPG